MSALPEFISGANISLVPLPEDPEFNALRDLPNAARFSSEQRALRDDLAAIAAKVGQPIAIPQRPFTPDEWLTIRMLRAVLRSGQVHRTWTRISFSLLPAQVRMILDEHGEQAFTLGGEQAHSFTVELFGTALQLGWYRFMVLQARVANIHEAWGQLAAVDDTGAPNRLDLVPGRDNRMEIRFPEWGLVSGGSVGVRRLDAAERIVLLEADESGKLNALLDQSSRRELSDQERRELDILVAKHRQRLLDRQIGLYAGQNGLELAEARRIVEAELAAATASWVAFESDPARVEAAVALARRRRASGDA